MSFVTNSDLCLYIFATQCSRPLIFEIKNPVRSNNQKFSTLGCKDIEIRKLDKVCGKNSTLVWRASDEQLLLILTN